MTETPTVLVRMSPELVEQLTEQGWVFGEPDADGFYEPWVSDSGRPPASNSSGGYPKEAVA